MAAACLFISHPYQQLHSQQAAFLAIMPCCLSHCCSTLLTVTARLLCAFAVIPCTTWFTQLRASPIPSCVLLVHCYLVCVCVSREVLMHSSC